jgi:single-stranded DNA-specific DHH superfamily exonuclease
MLQYEAFQMIESTKRGCKGQQEKLVEQAVRMSTNVKNRQTREQDAGIEKLEYLIKENNLLNHKIILFKLAEGDLDRNIAGLIANKLANKYQRPCCVLFKGLENNNIVYQGSARGYEQTGITNFKSICEAAGAEWCQGHENAFGMCLAEMSIEDFLTKTDAELATISAEPIYYVDYIYDNLDVNPSNILTIANLKGLWGKDMNEPYIAIERLKITPEMVNIYEKTSNTLKISLLNDISIMKFNITNEEYELFTTIDGYIELNLVGTCKQND